MTNRDIDNKYKVNLIRSSHPSTLPMPPSNWLKKYNHHI